MFLGSGLLTRIVFVMGFVVMLYSVKPRFIFKVDGKPRQWGVGVDEQGHRKTLLDARNVILVFCILLVKYYLKLRKPRLVYY
jgi:hypothetical protein